MCLSNSSGALPGFFLVVLYLSNSYGSLSGFLPGFLSGFLPGFLSGFLPGFLSGFLPGFFLVVRSPVLGVSTIIFDSVFFSGYALWTGLIPGEPLVRGGMSARDSFVFESIEAR